MDELKAALQKANERIAELEEELEKQKCASDNEETVTKAECEKRVQGMQASMQKQVNKYVDEINDFKNQLMAKSEELTKAQTEITSLKDSLEKASEELSKTASALEEKKNALEKLNSLANAKSDEEIPTMAEGLAKCASPAEKVAFLKSGRYVR
jgi:chromosome segregation ATPase